MVIKLRKHKASHKRKYDFCRRKRSWRRLHLNIWGIKYHRAYEEKCNYVPVSSAGKKTPVKSAGKHATTYQCGKTNKQWKPRETYNQVPVLSADKQTSSEKRGKTCKHVSPTRTTYRAKRGQTDNRSMQGFRVAPFLTNYKSQYSPRAS